MIVLGVDPGISGAIASFNAASGKLMSVHDMPSLTRGNRHEVDTFRLASIVDLFARSMVLAVVEDVGGMTYIDKRGERRGQGSAASFAFGKSTGVVIGVIAAYMVPIRYVSPSAWKIAMGLSADKDLSRTRAGALFPTFKDEFKRKKDDGRAEAALMAYYGALGLMSIRDHEATK